MFKVYHSTVCQVHPPATLQARLRPSNLHLRPFQVTPTTRKSPCRECAYDPQTSIYDPSRSHLYDPEIPHMEGREAGVASRGQSAQRWKDEKHKRGSIGFFGLQCTLPVKQRQRKTEKDRKQHTHTHTKTETRKSQFLNSAIGPGFGPKIWHQVFRDLSKLSKRIPMAQPTACLQPDHCFH